MWTQSKPPSGRLTATDGGPSRVAARSCSSSDLDNLPFWDPPSDASTGTYAEPSAPGGRHIRSLSMPNATRLEPPPSVTALLRPPMLLTRKSFSRAVDAAVLSTPDEMPDALARAVEGWQRSRMLIRMTVLTILAMGMAISGLALALAPQQDRGVGRNEVAMTGLAGSR